VPLDLRVNLVHLETTVIVDNLDQQASQDLLAVQEMQVLQEQRDLVDSQEIVVSLGL